ncbi:TauD/TfdA family dioxygenase [Micromonospora marina]|uniref:L-asparagine oxygenase n=1 Tax=Micromonospora marina TaxID=307120 RepID=A0A1C5AJ46_9ACTN|nr:MULTISPECIES: TauD/TfdA family dioxygenase [Micromonospora]SCF45044.1 L-asparagine oxygenase [Micromonospora marina]
MTVVRKRAFIGHQSLTLSSAERASVEALAVGLTQAPPNLVDDVDWLAEARTASCRLPARLMEAVRRFRHDPGAHGVLTIVNLPVGAGALPPTPSVPNSVERRATVASGTAMVLGHLLGEVIAYRSEKRGALVQDVVPVQELQLTQSNGGTVPLEFHTENAFHPNRPDFVGLLCLRVPGEEPVATRVASIRRGLALLNETDRAVLHESRFRTEAPPSFQSAGHSDPHSVLTGAAEDPDIRVDFHATTALDDRAATALARLREALLEVCVDLQLQPGEMAVLDNRLVVHGRSAYTPRFDGNDRWLHRIFVHLDPRRSRSRRLGGGPILD